MLNIGLKKHIKPYSKLSEFCGTFVSNIFPEYKIIVQKDEDYNFFYKQLLPNCELHVYLVLERDFTKADNLGFVKINVKCYVQNKLNKTSFYYEVTPNNLSAQQFVNHLNSDPTFREFHIFYNVLNTWNIIDDEIVYFGKEYSKGNYRHKAISPYEIEFKKNEFSIIPAIIRYENDNKQNFQKRYDFCLIISYSKYDFVCEEDCNRLDEPIYLRLDKFITTSDDKETSRKIKMEDMKIVNDDKYYEIVQSTRKDEVGLFKDLENPKNTKVSIVYKILGEEFTKKIDFKELLKIRELWSTYKDLSNCTDYNESRWKD